MRIPSASFCQRWVILLSSSSAIFEYKEKRGPELSPKFDSPCVGRGCWSCGCSWRSSTAHVDEFMRALTRNGYDTCDNLNAAVPPFGVNRSVCRLGHLKKCWAVWNVSLCGHLLNAEHVENMHRVNSITGARQMPSALLPHRICPWTSSAAIITTIQNHPFHRMHLYNKSPFPLGKGSFLQPG